MRQIIERLCANLAISAMVRPTSAEEYDDSDYFVEINPETSLRQMAQLYLDLSGIEGVTDVRPYHDSFDRIAHRLNMNQPLVIMVLR